MTDADQECKLPLTLSNSTVDLTDVDLLPDAFSDKNVVRTKTFLYVADLARKSSSFHGKKTRLYIWNLLVVSENVSRLLYGLINTIRLNFSR